MSAQKGLTVFGVLLLMFAIGTITFWIVFYTTGAVSASDRPAYLEHEKSFLLADIYMSITAMVAAIGFFRRRNWAILFGIMAGSAITFLGLMDTLYALEQNLIKDFSFASLETVFICTLCLIFGPATIICSWRSFSSSSHTGTNEHTI